MSELARLIISIALQYHNLQWWSRLWLAPMSNDREQSKVFFWTWGCSIFKKSSNLSWSLFMHSHSVIHSKTIFFVVGWWLTSSAITHPPSAVYASILKKKNVTGQHIRSTIPKIPYFLYNFNCCVLLCLKFTRLLHGWIAQLMLACFSGMRRSVLILPTVLTAQPFHIENNTAPPWPRSMGYPLTFSSACSPLQYLCFGPA